MGYINEAHRTLFGKTPVVIESAFPLEETQARIRLVLSRRFFSKRMQHTVKGRFDGRHFKMAHGYNHFLVLRAPGSGGKARSMPITTPRLVGHLIEEEGRVKIEAVLEASTPDRFNAVFLLGFLVFMPALILINGFDVRFGTFLVIGTVVSISLLGVLLHSLRFRGERLQRMLIYVLTKAQSRAELLP